MNKPSPRPKRERRKLPEVREITTLIDSARNLRLSVSALSNYPLLTLPAKEAVTMLQNTSAALETIADLVASAKTRSRTRHAQSPETSPPEPPLKNS